MHLTLFPFDVLFQPLHSNYFGNRDSSLGTALLVLCGIVRVSITRINASGVWLVRPMCIPWAKYIGTFFFIVFQVTNR